MSASARRPTCDHCAAPTRIWTRASFRGRPVCSLACATSLRAAERKAACDALDLNPLVCRCDGPPAPLESEGVHCRACRRMFSAQVRLWMATERASNDRLANLRLGFEQLVRRAFGRRDGVSHAV